MATLVETLAQAIAALDGDEFKTLLQRIKQGKRPLCGPRAREWGDLAEKECSLEILAKLKQNESPFPSAVQLGYRMIEASPRYIQALTLAKPKDVADAIRMEISRRESCPKSQP